MSQIVITQGSSYITQNISCDIISIFPVGGFNAMNKGFLFVALGFLIAAATPALSQNDPPSEKKREVMIREADARAKDAAKEASAATACPKIEIRSMNQIVREGTPVSFSAAQTGGDPAVTPTFVWSTSAGIIANGQGTRNISIDSNGAAIDRQITASLWVSGYPAECASQFSETVKVAGPARKVDEFAELTPDLEAEHIKNLTDSLYGVNDNIFVITYAGRNSPRGYATAALKRIKAQIVANGVTSDRIGIIDGGFREEPAYELWVVPVGADMPKATPTIKAKDIIYPKTTPAKKP